MSGSSTSRIHSCLSVHRSAPHTVSPRRQPTDQETLLLLSQAPTLPSLGSHDKQSMPLPGIVFCFGSFASSPHSSLLLSCLPCDTASKSLLCACHHATRTLSTHTLLIRDSSRVLPPFREQLLLFWLSPYIRKLHCSPCTAVVELGYCTHRLQDRQA